MAYKERYKVTAPVARSTAYDYNVQLSKSHQRSMQTADSEDRDVMPHEILFEPRDKLKQNNARIHACSSVNGIQLGTRCIGAVRACLDSCGCGYADAFGELECMYPSNKKVKELAEWLASNKQGREHASNVLTSFFTYIGVAITPCVAGARGGALQRQGFSATRGGLMTIVNTGTEALRAGDRVRMVIDVLDVVRGNRDHGSHVSGIPRTKIVARLAHVSPDATNFADVASGVTTRALSLRLNEPTVLTPMLEYVGRLRFPWDWSRHTAAPVPEQLGLTAVEHPPMPRGVSDQHIGLIGGCADAAGLVRINDAIEDADFADAGHYSVDYDTCEASYAATIVALRHANDIVDTDHACLRPDMWMFMLIRACEAYYYNATTDTTAADALRDEIVRTITFVAVVRANDAQLAPVKAAISMFARASQNFDGRGSDYELNPRAYHALAARLNALHECKKAFPVLYRRFGDSYVAAEVAAAIRATWNRQASVEADTATNTLATNMYHRWRADHAGVTLEGVGGGGGVGAATAWLGDRAREYIRIRDEHNADHHRRRGVLPVGYDRTFPPGHPERPDAPVSAAVLMQIMVLRAG